MSRMAERSSLNQNSPRPGGLRSFSVFDDTNAPSIHRTTHSILWKFTSAFLVHITSFYSAGGFGWMSFVRDLDTPLLQLSAVDTFTLRDACQGVHVFGGIGSGKTSGSGNALAAAYLRAGFCGVGPARQLHEV